MHTYIRIQANIHPYVQYKKTIILIQTFSFLLQWKLLLWSLVGIIVIVILTTIIVSVKKQTHKH